MSRPPEAGEQAAAVRRAAGLFEHRDRALIEVRGGDRVRWLDGMVSNDVAALAPGRDASGCHALLLTRQGRIVADLHVLLRPECFWLEVAQGAAAAVVEHLRGFIVADDVALAVRPPMARLGVEGPAAPEVLAAAAGGPLGLAAESCCEVALAGLRVLVAAFGWTGEPGFQIFGPAEGGARLGDALRAAGARSGLVDAGSEALEILRIESGIPRLGSELGRDVLPAEAGLEGAISFSKGCYTGQEVVARMDSRGRVKHRLVGLLVGGSEPVPVGEPVLAGEKPVGEVTSACRSPRHGSIALAFVRRPSDEPGTRVAVAGRDARVCALPFGAGTA